MKNKITAVILTVLTCVTLASCGVFVDSTSGSNSDSSVTDTSTVTITFKQEGKADIVKTLEKGDTLSDVPTPDSKTGYTVTWNRTDFTNITENITVTAVKTAKVYTVTLNPNGGTIGQKSFTIKYGEVYSLNTPTHNNSYMFIAWTYLQEPIDSNGVWDIDEEDGTIQLVAAWDLYSGEY